MHSYVTAQTIGTLIFSQVYCEKKTIFFLSLPLAGFIILTGCIGLFTNDFYRGETVNWKLQSIVQDTINILLVTPALILTTVFAIRNKNVFLLWGGINLYVVYTYVIYCFDVHFNSLFVIYCLSLGLSFYSVLYFLFLIQNATVSKESKTVTIIKITAVYFVVIALLFYFLWLAEIIPAIFNDEQMQSVKDIALPTNPVHVLDLSVILPAILITGFLLLRKKSIALLLAPSILMFIILMDITIAVISVITNITMHQSNYAIAIAMIILVFFNLLLLRQFLKTSLYYN